MGIQPKLDLIDVTSQPNVDSQLKHRNKQPGSAGKLQGSWGHPYAHSCGLDSYNLHEYPSRSMRFIPSWAHEIFPSPDKATATLHAQPTYPHMLLLISQVHSCVKCPFLIVKAVRTLRFGYLVSKAWLKS